MMDKVHNYMQLYTASNESTTRKTNRFFPSPFHFSTTSRLTLAEAFRKDYVASCSSALRSATEENESGGYVTVPCPSKAKQRSTTADWLEL